jgi:hypothetical protein
MGGDQGNEDGGRGRLRDADGSGMNRSDMAQFQQLASIVARLA